jgi:hypothetical protein
VIDTSIHWMRAEAALRAGKPGEALVHLRELIEVVDRIDFEYEEWLRAAAECMRALGQWREAAAAMAYLGRTEPPTEATLRAQLEALDQDDASQRRGARRMAIYLARARHHRAAADVYAAAQLPIHRAIALERAGDDAGAVELWQTIIAGDTLTDRPYELALARINLGLALHRLGSDRARLALAEATSAVEEVADRFETDGLRERAFDCYQLIARLGQEVGAFENVAEGYLNSVRILRDDDLRHDALRLYENFVARARDSSEWHAAASILREAADYCARVGLPYAEDLRLRAAEAWMRAAAEATAAGHPLPIVENAYLAAAESYASVRAFRQVAEAYKRLAALELPGRSADRYRRLVQRLGERPTDAPRPLPVPEFLRQQPEYEEVWYVDLEEYEIDGDAGAIAAGIMADKRFPDFVRRHALLLVLELERRGGDVAPEAVVRRLMAIRAYPVISALEAIYGRSGPAVRAEVAAALGKLRFKRSFALIGRALRDSDERVRAEACKAIETLVFPHAFEPLRRIFEARDLLDGAKVRVHALRAIGRINTPQALAFLIDRLREPDSAGGLIELAEAAVSELSNPELLPYLRNLADVVPAARRGAVEDTIRRLERSLA